MALIIQGVFRNLYGVSGLPYGIPPQLTGAHNLGFMVLPNYRAWVVLASLVMCVVTWLAIERIRLGATLGAALGALVVAMENYLSSIGGWVPVIEGVVYVVCVLGFREGMMGSLKGLRGTRAREA